MENVNPVSVPFTPYNDHSHHGSKNWKECVTIIRNFDKYYQINLYNLSNIVYSYRWKVTIGNGFNRKLENAVVFMKIFNLYKKKNHAILYMD